MNLINAWHLVRLAKTFPGSWILRRLAKILVKILSNQNEKDLVPGS